MNDRVPACTAVECLYIPIFFGVIVATVYDGVFVLSAFLFKIYGVTVLLL